MTLSIIILNYRSWVVTVECIRSIEKHPPTADYEIIVVDNDSQDGLLEQYVQQFKLVKFIKNVGNYGYSSGCNFGAQQALGEYLLFLNPDTEVTNSPAIDTMVSYAQTHADSGIVSCRKIKPGNKLEREITFINPWLTLGLARSLYKKLFHKKIQAQLPSASSIWHPQWLTGSIFLISAKTYQQVDGLSEKDYWMYFEEMDLAHKINQINKTITLIRDVEIKHQHGGSSRTNPKTSAITKSEVMVSRHVYIQKFYAGMHGTLLHASMMSISLGSQLLMALISLPFFWTKKGQASLLLLNESIRYYLRALFNQNWRSYRLPGDNS